MMASFTLHLGDCLDYMKTLPSGSVDAVITDPPYNSNVKYATYKDDLPPDEYWAWLSSIVEECKRISKGAIIVKHSSMKIGGWIRGIGDSRMVVWYKPFSSGFPAGGFAMHYEPLWLVGGKAVEWSKDVLIHSAGNANHESSTGHPAQMPESLARNLVNILTLPGDTVFDPFLGSGTTGVACMQTGRNFIGCEIDPGYYKIAQRRIEDAAAQPALIPHEAQQVHEQRELI